MGSIKKKDDVKKHSKTTSKSSLVSTADEPQPGEFGWKVPTGDVLHHVHVALETIRQVLDSDVLQAALQDKLRERSARNGEFADWILAFLAKLPEDGAKLYREVIAGLASHKCVTCMELFDGYSGLCDNCGNQGLVERFEPPHLKLPKRA